MGLNSRGTCWVLCRSASTDRRGIRGGHIPFHHALNPFRRQDTNSESCLFHSDGSAFMIYFKPSGGVELKVRSHKQNIVILWKALRMREWGHFPQVIDSERNNCELNVFGHQASISDPYVQCATPTSLCPNVLFQSYVVSFHAIFAQQWSGTSTMSMMRKLDRLPELLCGLSLTLLLRLCFALSL